MGVFILSDVCKDASHALQIMLVSDDVLNVMGGQPMGICLRPVH